LNYHPTITHPEKFVDTIRLDQIQKYLNHHYLTAAQNKFINIIREKSKYITNAIYPRTTIENRTLRFLQNLQPNELPTERSQHAN
jgi:hypothetical protein